ncbi:MAG TPA: hypothetical protein VFN13_08345 [Rudaea sp.]|nr:hypothetical protein [Rudaea sp.]
MGIAALHPSYPTRRGLGGAGRDRPCRYRLDGCKTQSKSAPKDDRFLTLAIKADRKAKSKSSPKDGRFLISAIKADRKAKSKSAPKDGRFLISAIKDDRKN